jgi:hypothetical protein
MAVTAFGFLRPAHVGEHEPEPVVRFRRTGIQRQRATVALLGVFQPSQLIERAS